MTRPILTAATAAVFATILMVAGYLDRGWSPVACAIGGAVLGLLVAAIAIATEHRS